MFGQGSWASWFVLMLQNGVGQGSKTRLPVAAIRVDSLKELLASSDVVTLHCGLSSDTVQLINAESLQIIKPGTFICEYSLCHVGLFMPTSGAL